MEFTPTPNPMNQAPGSPQSALPKHTPVGPWVGIAVVVILLVVGGFYFWGASLNARQEVEQPPLILGNDTNAQPELTSDEAAGLYAQGTSDDAATLQAEIDAMNMNQFEAEMENSVNTF